MKSIFVFIRNIGNSGGTERVVSEITNALDERGYNLSIITLFTPQKTFFRINEKIDIIALYDREESLSRIAAKAIRDLRSIVKLKRPDIFITVDSALNIITAPALYGIKTRKISWEHFNFNTPSTCGYKLGRYISLLMNDSIVVLTQDDKRTWQSKILGKDKVLQIYNPCSFEKTINKPTLDNKLVIAVGRLEPQKGFDLLIDAWNKVSKEHPDWKLRIIGSGGQLNNLNSQIMRYGLHGKVTIVNKTNDISKHYKEAAIYCLSSRFEGWGLVLVEAQQFNLPTISFDCDFGPREIIENNINGILVPNGSVDEFSNSLLTLISKPDIYNDMVKHLLESKESNLSKSTIISQWVDLMENV